MFGTQLWAKKAYVAIFYTFDVAFGEQKEADKSDLKKLLCLYNLREQYTLL